MGLSALALMSGGCASKTSVDEWKQYARGAYLQGMAVGKADITCRLLPLQAGAAVQTVPSGQPIPTAVVGVAPGAAEYCHQARADAAALAEVSRQVDYDLTNNQAERQKTLMRYLELGGKAAQP
jgi:hypothetical protein